MRKISAAEAARMGGSAEESLNDLCTIYHYVGATDSDTGEILDTYDSNPSFNVPCGLAIGHEFTNERGQIITIDADAVMRTEASIKAKDKVIPQVSIGATYIVDGVLAGRTVTIAYLKEIKV